MYVDFLSSLMVFPIQNAPLTKVPQAGIVYEAICDVRAMTHGHYG